jgi:hypothetical protein
VIFRFAVFSTHESSSRTIHDANDDDDMRREMRKGMKKFSRVFSYFIIIYLSLLGGQDIMHNNSNINSRPNKKAKGESRRIDERERKFCLKLR